MSTLSGAPDRVVSRSDFSLQHEKVRKINRICHTIFSSLFRFSNLTTYRSSVVLVLWLLSYKHPCLWRILTCVTCFGVILSIGSSLLLV